MSPKGKTRICHQTAWESHYMVHFQLTLCVIAFLCFSLLSEKISGPVVITANET